MNNNFDKELSKFSSRVYIYSIDIISFFKSLKKAGYEIPEIPYFANLIGKFSELILGIEDLNNFDQKIVELEKSSNFAAECLKLLQKIDCKNALLNEKSDLIIETYEIIKQISEILNIK